MQPPAKSSADRPLTWLSVVLVLLAASAVLIGVPALGSPTAGDVCNAGSFERRDELAAEKDRRATLVLVGATGSLLAAVVAFVAAVRRHWRWPMVALGVVALASAAAGGFVALLTALIVC